MRNLCILVNSLASGGGEKVAYTLFEKFRKVGINVFFVCLEKNDFYKVDHQVFYLSGQKGIRENGVKKLLSLVLFAFRLNKLIKKEKISLVQSHLYRANYVNVIAKLLGSPHKLQLVNHGIVSRYKKEGIAGRLNLFLIKHLYHRADQVVCPSKGMMNDLIQLIKFKNDIGRYQQSI